MDSWKEGTRVISEIAAMLNMKGLLTSIRVDRHEIAFRVENNPNKTAYDVARAINDDRFKANLSRRFGVIVARAGVGNKTKEIPGVSSTYMQDHGEGDSLSYMMPFMLAAAAAAACIIIIIMVCFIRGHGRNKYKLGDLQSSFSNPAEKDYQDLCRARMTTKNSSSNMPVERVIMTSTQNERPPSSRSSTSSWSEEPALTNMDISTGHMVLVCILLKISIFTLPNCVRYTNFAVLFSHTWKIIFEIKVDCNENGMFYVDTKPNQMHVTPLCRRSAHS